MKWAKMEDIHDIAVCHADDFTEVRQLLRQDVERGMLPPKVLSLFWRVMCRLYIKMTVALAIFPLRLLERIITRSSGISWNGWKIISVRKCRTAILFHLWTIHPFQKSMWLYGPVWGGSCRTGCFIPKSSVPDVISDSYSPIILRMNGMYQKERIIRMIFSTAVPPAAHVSGLVPVRRSPQRG